MVTQKTERQESQQDMKRVKSQGMLKIEKGGQTMYTNHLSNLRRRVSGGYFAGCFHIHPAAPR